MRNFLFFLSVIYVIHFSVNSAHAALTPNAYVPAASINWSAAAASVKSTFFTIYNWPVDAASRVYPAVANGARMGASMAGAMASSVYAGSAAAASKMFIPIQNGANFAMDIAGHIPRSRMASAAMSMMRNPYFAAAAFAGSAIYEWLNAADMRMNPDGTFSSNAGSCYSIAGLVNTYCASSLAALCKKIRNNYNPVGTQPWETSATLIANLLTCYNSQTSYTYTVTNSSLTDGVPKTDAQVTTDLANYPIPNAAAALDQLTQNGEAPATDPPIASAPSPQQLPASTTVNPDGTSTVVTPSLTSTCSGDTCTITQTTKTETKSAAGVVTGTSTRTEPPLVATGQGAIPAVLPASQVVDITPLVAAVNAAATQARADAQQIPIDTAKHVLDDTPTSVPLVPDILPDEDFPSFMQTVNPFNWNPLSFLPALPVTSCTYEIHRTFHVPFLGNKPFDLAPCNELAPLRSVLGWVFGVLTALGVFFIIFRAQAQL